MVISPTWWRELLYFLKVFRTAFGSYISQSNYTRGEFSCLLLSTVGCGECFLSFLFSFFFLFLLDWAVDCECWYMEWLQRWSETQRTLLATGGKRRPLWSMCVRTKSVKKKKTKKNNVKYEQVLVCAAGARNCYTPLSLPLYPSLCFRCV